MTVRQRRNVPLTYTLRGGVFIGALRSKLDLVVQGGRCVQWFAWAFDPSNAQAVAGWGFWIAVLSLPITLVGFGATIWQLRKTRSAASAAQQEALRIQSSLERYEAVNELSRAITALKHTRNLVQQETWVHVPDSYETVRASLEALKDEGLDDEIIKRMDSACKYIQNLAARIERGIHSSNIQINTPKALSVMREHNLLLSEIRRIFEKRVVQ